MRPYPYLSSFSSLDADAALSIRAERPISRMFSQITTNQIGKSYKGTGLKAGPNEGDSLGPKPNEHLVQIACPRPTIASVSGYALMTEPRSAAIFLNPSESIE